MPAGSTYTPIATVTTTSGQTSYTFSSIPSTYTDLVLVTGSLSAGALCSMTITLNGDTSTNYSDTSLTGNGSSATTGRDTSTPYAYSGLFINGEVSTNIVHFMNYSNTTTYKTFLTRANIAGWGVRAIVALWRSTAAINSIQVKPDGQTWTAGGTITLYGIAAA